MERINIEPDFVKNVKFIIHKNSFFSFSKGSIDHGTRNNLTISACPSAHVKISESELIYGNDNMSEMTNFFKTREGSELELIKCTFLTRAYSINCETTCEFSGGFFMCDCIFENNPHTNKPKLIFSFLQVFLKFNICILLSIVKRCHLYKRYLFRKTCIFTISNEK